MSERSRRIFSSNRTSRSELAALIEWLFVAELLAPSDQIWLVAHGIDNAPIFDNSGGTFDALDPGWGRRTVRLMEVVLRVAAAGTRVFVVTQESDRSSSFMEELPAAAKDQGLSHVVRTATRPWLISPGIHTRHGLLRGALDLGVDAIGLRDDVVTFDAAPVDLTDLHMQLRANIADQG